MCVGIRNKNKPLGYGLHKNNICAIVLFRLVVGTAGVAHFGQVSDKLMKISRNWKNILAEP
jgi:hypothetical protein